MVRSSVLSLGALVVACRRISGELDRNGDVAVRNLEFGL
jgi:hypothetical protein